MVGRRPGFHSAHKVPMLRAASPQRRFFDVVSRLHPRGGAATGVAGDAAPGLAGLRVQGDGNVGLGSDFKVNGVRVNDLSSGNLDGFLPVVESKGFDGGDVDSGYAGLTAGRETNRRRRNGQVAAAKGIADLDTDAVGANGHVEGLSEGCVLEYTTAGLVCFVVKLTNFFSSLIRQLTKGDGGMLFCSTSCGIDVQVATHFSPSRA